MQPTLTNIARLAEVSPSTVSRIINGAANFPVSPATRDRVLRIANQLNYEPKRAARALVSGKTYTAAVVLGRFERDLAIPTFSLMVGELARALWGHGYALTMLPVDVTKNLDDELLRMLRGSHADGYFVPYSMLQPKTLAELKRAGTPVVSIHRESEAPNVHDERDECDDDSVVSYAWLDEYVAAREVIGELVRLGHREVACFGEIERCRKRFAPYREVAATYPPGTIRLRDCSYAQRQRGWLYARPDAQRAARERFDELAGCTAVLCHSDQIAFGLMDVMDERGLEPGRDLSVIGQDNLEMNPACSVEPPRLSTVDRRNDALGQAIAQLLLDRMAGNNDGERIVTLPTRFISRSTHGAANPAAVA